jgi:hypothetical protein
MKKIYEVLQNFQIPNKHKAGKNNNGQYGSKSSTPNTHVELYGIRDDLKQGDGLARLPFILIMEYVMRKVTAERNTLQYTLIQIFIITPTNAHIIKILLIVPTDAHYYKIVGRL